MDVIQLAYKATVKAGKDPSQCIVDISQDGSRRPYSQMCRSITTSSHLFLFAVGRCLTPTEHLNIQGFPKLSLKGLGDPAVKDLAGESMSPPCITLVILAALLSLPTVFTSGAGAL